MIDEMRSANAADDNSVGHLYVSPDDVRDLHRVLMADLLSGARPAGTYRSNPAYPDGYHFMYSSPETIESHMFEWTDALADILFTRQSLTLEESFKVSALVVFNFLDVHPFSDGNGRLARILASHILSSTHFFPVYTVPVSDRKPKEVYLGAIQACRDSNDQYPRDLAALLVESSWLTWCRVRQIIRQVFVSGSVCLGCIGVTSQAQSGTSLEQYIFERWKALNHTLRERKPDEQQLRGEAKDALAAIQNIQRPFSVILKLQDKVVVQLQLK